MALCPSLEDTSHAERNEDTTQMAAVAKMRDNPSDLRRAMWAVVSRPEDGTPLASFNTIENTTLATTSHWHNVELVGCEFTLAFACARMSLRRSLSPCAGSNAWFAPAECVTGQIGQHGACGGRALNCTAAALPPLHAHSF